LYLGLHLKQKFDKILMHHKTEKHSNGFRRQKSFTRKACPEFYHHLIADKFSLKFPLCITSRKVDTDTDQTSLLLFLAVFECLVPVSNKLIQLLLAYRNLQTYQNHVAE